MTHLSVAPKKDQSIFSSVEELIEDARNGRMVILVDDEDRENEGDLVIPAQMATPDIINFMATYGRGLICLAMESAMIERLGLPMMTARNTSGFETAFTVSIEAREGVSTGISAPDRAKTIQVAINPKAGPQDISMPGHVFPLRAQDGGVLVRAGHTEASVEMARLAGFSGAGVICEIMKDDGEMARLDDLLAFAKAHGLKVGSIADMIAYRLQNEKCVEVISEETISSRFGGTFLLRHYKNNLTGEQHMALIKGHPDFTRPVHVRMHALDVVKDVLGFGEDVLHSAMRYIGDKGEGVLVLLNREQPSKKQEKTEQAFRSYGIGAQILHDIGVRDMILLSNSEKNVVGLHGFGLNIVSREALPSSE